MWKREKKTGKNAPGYLKQPEEEVEEKQGRKDVLVGFEELDQLQNVRMTSAGVEDFNLLENSRANRMRSFLNSLDSKLALRATIAKRSDSGVRASAELLASSFVQLVEATRATEFQRSALASASCGVAWRSSDVVDGAGDADGCTRLQDVRVHVLESQVGKVGCCARLRRRLGVPRRRARLVAQLALERC